jgi:hypothetical protein
MGALFARIVVYSAKTAAIYAGFAVVLLFLVWLYLSWLILLLGAQLSFYVQHPEHLRTGHAEIPMTGALRERLALSVMYLVGERFRDGGARWTIADLAERLDVPGTVLDEIVTALQAHGLVLDVEDDTVAPARDLAAIRSTRSWRPCGTRHPIRGGRRRGRARGRRGGATRRRGAGASLARPQPARPDPPGRLTGASARSGAGDGHLLDEDRAGADPAARVHVGADLDDAAVHVAQVAGDR